jgi:hypothetical protein
MRYYRSFFNAENQHLFQFVLAYFGAVPVTPSKRIPSLVRTALQSLHLQGTVAKTVLIKVFADRVRENFYKISKRILDCPAKFSQSNDALFSVNEYLARVARCDKSPIHGCDCCCKCAAYLSRIWSGSSVA